MPPLSPPRPKRPREPDPAVTPKFLRHSTVWNPSRRTSTSARADVGVVDASDSDVDASRTQTDDDIIAELKHKIKRMRDQKDTMIQTINALNDALKLQTQQKLDLELELQQRETTLQTMKERMELRQQHIN